jgi:hypothetical protein
VDPNDLEAAAIREGPGEDPNPKAEAAPLFDVTGATREA